MGEGIHRINAPRVTRVVVCCAADAVNGGVAHIDIGRGHINFRAEHRCTICEIASAHVTKPRQVVRCTARAEGTIHTGFTKVATVDAHLFCALFIDIRMTCFNQTFSGRIHEIKVIARLVLVQCAVCFPRKPEPMHGIQNGIDVFGIFFFWIGVVKAQVANAAIVTSQSEIDANAFGMSYVQVAVGLWRKTGANFCQIWTTFGLMHCATWCTCPTTVGIGALR